MLVAKAPSPARGSDQQRWEKLFSKLSGPDEEDAKLGILDDRIGMYVPDGGLDTESELSTGPSGICVSRSGNVFVADSVNHVVKEFDKSGKLRMITQVYQGNLGSIAVSSQGRVYTTSGSSLNTITCFNEQGKADWQVNVSCTIDALFPLPEGALAVTLNDDNRTTLFFSSTGVVITTQEGQPLSINGRSDPEGDSYIYRTVYSETGLVYRLVKPVASKPEFLIRISTLPVRLYKAVAVLPVVAPPVVAPPVVAPPVVAPPVVAPPVVAPPVVAPPVVAPPQIDYNLLLDQNLYYPDLERARVLGLSQSEIAGSLKIVEGAHNSWLSLSDVVTRLLGGETYQSLADQYDLPVEDILDVREEQLKILAYRRAYEATGIPGGLPGMQASQMTKKMVDLLPAPNVAHDVGPTNTFPETVRNPNQQLAKDPKEIPVVDTQPQGPLSPDVSHESTNRAPLDQRLKSERSVMVDIHAAGMRTILSNLRKMIVDINGNMYLVGSNSAALASEINEDDVSVAIMNPDGHLVEPVVYFPDDPFGTIDNIAADGKGKLYRLEFMPLPSKGKNEITAKAFTTKLDIASTAP